jgi:hypothetical protein
MALPVFNVTNGKCPQEGPRAIPFTFVFDGTAAKKTQTQNFNPKDAGLTGLQAIYVDNSNGQLATLTVSTDVLQQKDFIAPGAISIVPLVLTEGVGITLTISQSVAEAAIVQVLLFNVFLPPATWGGQTPRKFGYNNMSVPGIQFLIPGAQQWTKLLSANANRKGFWVCIDETVTDEIIISGSNASGPGLGNYYHLGLVDPINSYISFPNAAGDIYTGEIWIFTGGNTGFSTSGSQSLYYGERT